MLKTNGWRRQIWSEVFLQNVKDSRVSPVNHKLTPLNQQSVSLFPGPQNKNYSMWKCNSRYCKDLTVCSSPTLGVIGCEKRHSFRQYNSVRGREAWCISKWRGVESKGHRLDMTDNTPNTKQCDREVELTSPGFTTLTSQLGLAPIPHTFLSFSLSFFIVLFLAARERIQCTELRVLRPVSQQNYKIWKWVLDTFLQPVWCNSL